MRWHHGTTPAQAREKVLLCGRGIYCVAPCALEGAREGRLPPVHNLYKVPQANETKHPRQQHLANEVRALVDGARSARNAPGRAVVGPKRGQTTCSPMAALKCLLPSVLKVQKKIRANAETFPQARSTDRDKHVEKRKRKIRGKVERRRKVRTFAQYKVAFGTE